MLYAIQGVISHKEPTLVIVKTKGGVSYGVHISLFSSSKIQKGDELELLTTCIIKEDSHKLYGFLDKNEQNMFELLLKVNGVGANTAMAVCSSLSVNDFYKALQMGDENALKKVPGIGLKSAKRIIVELGDKKANLTSTSSEHAQALAALISLGFKQEKALEALAKCEAKEVGELVKEALKQLS